MIYAHGIDNLITIVVQGIEIATALVLDVDALDERAATLVRVPPKWFSLDADDLWCQHKVNPAGRTHLAAVVHDEIALCNILASKHAKPARPGLSLSAS